MEHPQKKWKLSSPERTLLETAANAFFPEGGPIPLSGSEANVVDYFDDYVNRAQPAQQLLMRLLFAFIELGPLVFGPRFRPFSRLSPEDRIRFLDGARESRIYFRRVSFVSLRALMTMAYLSHPEVARHMKMEPSTDPYDMDVAHTPVRGGSRDERGPRAAEVMA